MFLNICIPIVAFHSKLLTHLRAGWISTAHAMKADILYTYCHVGNFGQTVKIEHERKHGLYRVLLASRAVVFYVGNNLWATMYIPFGRRTRLVFS
jgi:hypothetical protein